MEKEQEYEQLVEDIRGAYDDLIQAAETLRTPDPDSPTTTAPVGQRHAANLLEQAAGYIQTALGKL